MAMNVENAIDPGNHHTKLEICNFPISLYCSRANMKVLTGNGQFFYSSVLTKRLHFEPTN